jgi:hypothetical protein
MIRTINASIAANAALSRDNPQDRDCTIECGGTG